MKTTSDFLLELANKLPSFCTHQLINRGEIFELSKILARIIRILPPLALQPELNPQLQAESRETHRTALELIQYNLRSTFVQNCHVKHYITTAARVLKPQHCTTLAVPDCCRRVIWAFEGGKISQLDVISYCYILVLSVCVQDAQNEQDLSFTEYKQSVLISDVNGYSMERELVRNTLSSTLQVFKTEVGSRKGSLYQELGYLLQAAELLQRILKLKLEATEELQFETLCLKANQLQRDIFQLQYQRLSGFEVAEIYRNAIPDDDVLLTQDLTGELAEFMGVIKALPRFCSSLQTAILNVTVGCLLTQKLQSYVDQMETIRARAESLRQQQRLELSGARDAFHSVGEGSAIQFQNQLIQKQKVYKKFSDLAPEQQIQLKFRACDNLYSYILMKKRLGLSLRSRLFGSDNYDLQNVDLIMQQNGFRDTANVSTDDQLFAQQQLKLQQLQQVLKTQERRNQQLQMSQRTANSFNLLSKTTQLQNYIVNDFAESAGTFVVGRNSVAQKQNVVICESLSTYVKNLKDTQFYSTNQYFNQFSCFRETLFVLLFCRAIYITQVFQITEFSQLSQYQNVFGMGDALISSQTYVPNQVTNSNVGYESFGRSLRKEEQTSYQPVNNLPMSQVEVTNTPGSLAASAIRQDVLLVDASGKAKKVTTVVDVEQSWRSVASSQFAPEKREVARLEQFMYTNSVLRLVYDNSLINSQHQSYLFYLRWLCLQNRTTVKANISDEQAIEEQLIQLRLFVTGICTKLMNGGNDIGFLPYVQNFSEVVAFIITNQQVLTTFDNDELAYMLIVFWIFPFVEDYFQLLKAVFDRASNCTIQLQRYLKQVLGDLYLYCDTDIEDLPLASYLFNKA